MFHQDQRNSDMQLKKDDFYEFETDILKKFDNLIKIENFGNKL